MKKQFLTLIFIGIIMNTSAQISKSSMLKKVKSLHPTNRISAKMDVKGYEERVWEKDKWVYYYRHGYTIVSKTKYPGITHQYKASLQYKKTAHQYNYDLYTVGDGVYLGVPSPDKTQIIKLINSDLKNFLGDYHYNSIVGEISKIELVQEPEWEWKKLNMLMLKARAVFNEKISDLATQKSEHIFKIVLHSDTYKSPWNKFTAYEIENEKKILGQKEYSYEALKRIKTLAELDTEKQVTKKISGMPQIDLPIFTKDLDLYALTHNVIMTKDAEVVKAFLYKVMAKSCKEDGNDVILTYLTQQWFDKIIQNLDTYRTTHYIKPKVKHYQSGLMQFYDKENKRAIDIEGIQEYGTWKIHSIRYYPAKEDAINRMKNI